MIVRDWALKAKKMAIPLYFAKKNTFILEVIYMKITMSEKL